MQAKVTAEVGAEAEARAEARAEAIDCSCDLVIVIAGVRRRRRYNDRKDSKPHLLFVDFKLMMNKKTH